MKISILMPVCNTSAFLRECLDSILGQTEKDWELLAVDDFSTDDSYAILSEYAARDDRIRAYRNDRKGIAPALEKAYANSTGDLITRMDSDDRMLPQKLIALKKRLTKSGTTHVATGCVDYFSENGVGEGYRKYAEWLNELTRTENNFSEIYKECVIPSPCWMAFRSDLNAVRAFQEEVYPEDYDLCFRMRQAGLKVAGEEAVLHQWRDHPGRTSRTHEHYQDNAFLELKINWFLQSDYDPGRPLVIWGAGKKGKRLTNLLNAKNTSFGWVTNNEEKTGKEIRGILLRKFDIIRKLKDPQIIIVVASPDGQDEIAGFLKQENLMPGYHYFFFC